MKEPVEPYVERFIGSKGIDVKILFDSLDPTTGPLDPQNLLLFGAGPLVATPFPGASRTDVMARSPLAGGVGSSSMGGYFAGELKLAGYDNLVVEGKAERPVYLSIRDGRIEVRDAAALWGQDTFDTPSLIRERTACPLFCRTACIALFSARTSAVKPAMPLRRAMVIRYRSRKVPIPRPCQSSRTMKATSARLVLGST